MPTRHELRMRNLIIVTSAGVGWRLGREIERPRYETTWKNLPAIAIRVDPEITFLLLPNARTTASSGTLEVLVMTFQCQIIDTKDFKNGF